MKSYLRAIADPISAEQLTSNLAENAVFGEATGRVAIAKVFQEQIDNGLVAHNPLGTVGGGDFLAGIFELVQRDGTRQIAPGILRFNEDNLVAEAVTAEPKNIHTNTNQVEQYLRVVEGFNRGDLVPMSEVLTDDCVFEGVGQNKAEILKAMQQARDDGWSLHNVIGTVAGGQWLVAVYQNVFVDGHSIIGAGIQRFNAAGLCDLLVGREPGPVGTVTT
jgi:hypothetical protein